MNERKSVETGLIDIDEDQGIVTAIVSVTGVKDKVNDIIEPGAYTKTLSTTVPKGCWGHDWGTPVARTIEAKELMPGDPNLPPHIAAIPGAGGLLVKMQFNLDTTRGREAFSDVKFFGSDQEWSIGYKAKETTNDRKAGVRRIKSLDCYEYSPVLFGAMPLAGTVSVKDLAIAITEVRAHESHEEEPEENYESIEHHMTYAGSWEETKVAINDALKAAFMDSEYVLVEGTFADRIIVTMPGMDGKPTLFQIPWQSTNDGVTLGVPAEVDVEMTTTEKSLNDLIDEVKAGRVLSASNEKTLRDAISALSSILDSMTGTSVNEHVDMATEDAVASEEDVTPKEMDEKSIGIDMQFEIMKMETEMLRLSGAPGRAEVKAESGMPGVPRRFFEPEEKPNPKGINQYSGAGGGGGGGSSKGKGGGGGDSHNEDDNAGPGGSNVDEDGNPSSGPSPIYGGKGSGNRSAPVPEAEYRAAVNVHNEARAQAWDTAWADAKKPGGAFNKTPEQLAVIQAGLKRGQTAKPDGIYGRDGGKIASHIGVPDQRAVLSKFDRENPAPTLAR